MPKLKTAQLSITGGLMMMALVASMVGATMSGGRVLASTEATSTAAVTVSSSCMMNAVVNTPHEAEVVASTYQNNIGKTTISTICNDVNGYSIYAVGYTNTEWGRNDMLGTNTGRTIATGTATSGGTSDWAMKLTAVAGNYTPTVTTGYDAYHEVPSEYTKVASYNNTTGDSSDPSQLETTYAVYATSNQSPDVYVGKVKYTLVHSAGTVETPCMGTYTINYNANGGSGLMDSQTVCADKQIGLLPNGFTPLAPTAENQFAVWNTAADGSGYTYLAGQSVANLAPVDGSVTLYAQWAPKYMQDFTVSMCRTFATEGPYTVYDRRDGNDYTVRYFADACWMTQNLRIVGTINRQYSNFSTYENVNVCESDLTSGGSNIQPRCHNSNNKTNGAWYNYAAASAKTIAVDSNSTNATEDICPTGWRLPNYDENNVVAGSINSLMSDSVIRTNFVPVTGGYYNGGYGSILSYDRGFWWSSTAQSSSDRFLLYYSNGDSYLSKRNDSRYQGFYIRCVRISN